MDKLDSNSVVGAGLLSVIHFVNGDTQEALDLLQALPQLYVSWWGTLYRESPRHIVVETALLLFIVWLLFFQKTASEGSSENKIPKPIQERLIQSWKPAPLVEPVSEQQKKRIQRVPESRGTLPDGRLRLVERDEEGEETGEVEALNFASFDFLGMSNRPDIKQVSKETMEKYGCGSCGPRGFYGTIDVHLNLEEHVASLMHVNETISYSDGSSTLSSAIPAFAKKGDLIIMDEEVNFAIRTGVNLSRAHVHTFKHNDVTDLQRILDEVSQKDRENPQLRATQRRFIILESVYRSTGDTAPLEAIVRMKAQVSAYLVVDESMAFGVAGEGGLGFVREVRGRSDWNPSLVDIHLFSLEAAVGSVGGMCVGEQRVVDHQRLSGAGYCFSASTPPFLHAAALLALQLIEGEEGERLRAQLYANVRRFLELVGGSSALASPSSGETPIVLVRLPEGVDVEDTLLCLQREHHVLALDEPNRPGHVKLCFSATQTEEQVEALFEALEACVGGEEGKEKPLSSSGRRRSLRLQKK